MALSHAQIAFQGFHCVVTINLSIDVAGDVTVPCNASDLVVFIPPIPRGTIVTIVFYARSAGTSEFAMRL